MLSVYGMKDELRRPMTLLVTEKIVKQRPLNLFLIRKRFGGLYWLIDVIKMITSIQKNALANESP